MSDRRVGWALFVGGFLLLLATEKPVGFTRDESFYFHAAGNHAGWFKAFAASPRAAMTDAVIEQHFGYNAEHPSLMKNLFGLSYLVFHEKLQWVRPATAFRLPAFAVAAWMLPLIYALARRFAGRGASLFAAISFFLVPRQFFHSHLSCFDVPIATMWVFTIYSYVKAQETRSWWLMTGVAFGLALATKHNAYFIVPTLVPLVVWRGWETLKVKPRAGAYLFGILGVFVFAVLLYTVMALMLGRQLLTSFELQSAPTTVFVVTVSVGAFLTSKLRREDETAFRAVAPVVAMAVLGPAIFYVHWPHLWHHPVDRTAAYFAFHLNHEHYAWFYLGELLRGPPFPLSYVLVKTALTVPTAIFALMVLGFGAAAWRALRGKSTGLETLLIFNALASILLISAPNVPHFGGVKHWFPSMAFLAVFAAVALERSAAAWSEWSTPKLKVLTPPLALGALAVLVGSSGLIATARVYEFGTSSYSELAGGLPGAASLGMQRQFWANNLSGVLPWLNANLRPGERVYLHENHGLQWKHLKENGLLRQDVVTVGSIEQAETVVYQYHQEFRDAEFLAWQVTGSMRPVHGLYLDETPQIVIYRRGAR